MGLPYIQTIGYSTSIFVWRQRQPGQWGGRPSEQQREPKFVRETGNTNVLRRGRFFEISALLRRFGLVSLSGVKATLGVSR